MITLTLELCLLTRVLAIFIEIRNNQFKWNRLSLLSLLVFKVNFGKVSLCSVILIISVWEDNLKFGNLKSLWNLKILCHFTSVTEL